MRYGGRGTETANKAGLADGEMQFGTPSPKQGGGIAMPCILLCSVHSACAPSAGRCRGEHQPGTPFCVEADILGALEWGQTCHFSLFLDMHVAKSFPLAQHGPKLPTESGQKQGWLHCAFSSSCSHPAALLPPSVMTFPLLCQGESQICLQSLLGGLSFARATAKHHRPKG